MRRSISRTRSALRRRGGRVAVGRRAWRRRGRGGGRGRRRRCGRRGVGGRRGRGAAPRRVVPARRGRRRGGAVRRRRGGAARARRRRERAGQRRRRWPSAPARASLGARMRRAGAARRRVAGRTAGSATSPAGGVDHAVRRRRRADALAGGEPRDARLACRQFWRSSVALRLDRARDAGVQLQQRDLHGHDAAEQRRRSPDPRAPAQQAVDDPVVGQRARGARTTPVTARGARSRAAARRPAPETRRGRAGRGRARGATRVRRGVRAGVRRRAAGISAGSSLSLRAARRRADFERGLCGDLARRRDDRAAEHELGLGRAPAPADRQVGRADAAARAVGEEALDAPVLERVEGDRGEPAAGAQQRPRRAGAPRRAGRARR